MEHSALEYPPLWSTPWTQVPVLPLTAKRFNALQNPVCSGPGRSFSNKERESRVKIFVIKFTVHLLQIAKHAGFAITANISHVILKQMNECLWPRLVHFRDFPHICRTTAPRAFSVFVCVKFCIYGPRHVPYESKKVIFFFTFILAYFVGFKVRPTVNFCQQ